MSKIYAVIYPAITKSEESIPVLPWLITASIHKLSYERVCGYSLGHEAKFFTTMLAAEEELKLANDSYQMQHAIVELEIDGIEIKKFCKLYTINKLEQSTRQTHSPGIFKPIKVPVWESEVIIHDDLSSGALAEINRQFKRAIDADKIDSPSTTAKFRLEQSC